MTLPPLVPPVGSSVAIGPLEAADTSSVPWPAANSLRFRAKGAGSGGLPCRREVAQGTRAGQRQFQSGPQAGGPAEELFDGVEAARGQLALAERPQGQGLAEAVAMGTADVQDVPQLGGRLFASAKAKAALGAGLRGAGRHERVPGGAQEAHRTAREPLGPFVGAERAVYEAQRAQGERLAATAAEPAVGPRGLFEQGERGVVLAEFEVDGAREAAGESGAGVVAECAEDLHGPAAFVT